MQLQANPFDISYSNDMCNIVGLDHGGYGKPHLPPVPESNANLVDLVGPDSSQFFTIIDMPCQFLHKPASEWTDHDDYLNIARIMNKFQVVNETAEVCHDFVNVTRDERRFQEVL
ncbi:uncharacterized protein LOC143033895 [Oratosquilla oratoria]|uniref:uncharacterized protein LOC143033895 n=1 Tax=Oratosquilla oratoria TaxID=337810 RepID=UPI003F75C59C